MIAYLRKLLFLTPIASITLLCSCSQGRKDDGYVAYFGGEIINPNSKFVYLCKDNEVIDTIELDGKNRFLTKYDSLAPGMYTFKHDPEYQYIYFEKNDSLMIRLNTNEFDGSLTFCGRGDEKNNFLMELFLKNEADRNASFELFDKDFKTFSKAIDKDYNATKAFYLRRQTEVNWSEDFDLYAKNMLDMHYFSKKEMYPFVHERRTNEKVCKSLPKNYYGFRKEIDYNNEKLTSFSPFLRYLTSMLNNVACKNDEKYLENNIKKLHIADSIFTNAKIKNTILNNIAFMYLMEDQNVMNNKVFLDKYFKLSSDKVKQKEIKKIGQSIQMLAPNKKLQSVDLIDVNGKPVDIKNALNNKNTVISFWTSEDKSHMELAHKRVAELQVKHPNWNFVSINIHDTPDKWKEILTKYNFKNAIELHSANFEDLKEKWVITKIHRVMLVNPDATIKNGFVNLFDAQFESYLK